MLTLEGGEIIGMQGFFEKILFEEVEQEDNFDNSLEITKATVRYCATFYKMIYKQILGCKKIVSKAFNINASKLLKNHSTLFYIKFVGKSKLILIRGE